MELIKAKIVEDGDTLHYFDKEGNELHDGDLVRFDGEVTIDGEPIERNVYLTDDGQLGVGATNPAWIEKGYKPWSFGIYPIGEKTLAGATLIKGETNDNL